MTTWNYTFGELHRRGGRTLLTLAGVAIGVSILVAASASIESARVAYRDLFDLAGNEASLEIVAPVPEASTMNPSLTFVRYLVSATSVRALLPPRRSLILLAPRPLESSGSIRKWPARFRRLRFAMAGRLTGATAFGWMPTLPTLAAWESART